MLEIFGISKIDSGKWMDTDQCISDYQRESTRNIKLEEEKESVGIV